MSGIINIILGAVILFLVVVAFLWVSTKHKESGLGDTCSGNCSSCRAHCKDEAKTARSLRQGWQKQLRILGGRLW